MRGRKAGGTAAPLALPITPHALAEHPQGGKGLDETGISQSLPRHRSAGGIGKGVLGFACEHGEGEGGRTGEKVLRSWSTERGVAAGIAGHCMGHCRVLCMRYCTVHCVGACRVLHGALHRLLHGGIA